MFTLEVIELAEHCLRMLLQYTSNQDALSCVETKDKSFYFSFKFIVAPG